VTRFDGWPPVDRCDEPVEPDEGAGEAETTPIAAACVTKEERLAEE
jgi:hypothetical protein